MELLIKVYRLERERERERSERGVIKPMEMETTKRNEYKGSSDINNTHNNMSEEITSVDWRGKPSNPSKHGGMRAATFVLGK